MLFIMLFAGTDILVNDYSETPTYFLFVRPSVTSNSKGERCLFYFSQEFLYSPNVFDPNLIVYKPHDTLFLRPFATAGGVHFFITYNGFWPCNSSNGNAVITEDGSIYEVFVAHGFDGFGRDKFLITNIVSDKGELLKTFQRKIDFVNVDFIYSPMIKVLTNNQRFAWVYMDSRGFYWQAYDMHGDSLTRTIIMPIGENGYADACMLSDGSIIVGYYQQNDSCIYWVKYDTLGKQVIHPHSIETNHGKGSKLHISILYPGTSALEEELLVTWIEDNHLYCRVFSKDLEPVGDIKELDNGEEAGENYAIASFRGRETGVVWSNMEGKVYITTMDNNLNITGTKYLTENIYDATLGCNEKDNTYDIFLIEDQTDLQTIFTMHSITTDRNGNIISPLQQISNATGYHQAVVRVSMNKDGKFAVVYREIKSLEDTDHQTYMYIFDREGNPLVEKKFIDSVGYFTNVYMRENDVTVAYHNGNDEITFKTYDLQGTELKETKVKYNNNTIWLKEIDFRVVGDTIDMFTENKRKQRVMHKKILLGSKDDSLTAKDALPLWVDTSTPSCQVRYLDKNKYLIAFTEKNMFQYYGSLVYYVDDSIYHQVYVPTSSGHSDYVVGNIENNRVIGMVEEDEIVGNNFYAYAVYDTNFNLIMDTTLSYHGAIFNYGGIGEHTSDIIMHNKRAILLLTDFTLEHIRAKGLILNTETGKIIGELPIGADIDEPWYRTVVNKGSVAGNDSLFVIVWLDNRNNRGFDVYAHVYRWEDFEGIEEKKDISNTIVKLTGTDLFLNTDSYTIYDIQGRVVLKGNQSKLSLKTFTRGIYFIKYKNNNKEVVKKLVIVR